MRVEEAIILQAYSWMWSSNFACNRNEEEGTWFVQLKNLWRTRVCLLEIFYCWSILFFALLAALEIWQARRQDVRETRRFEKTLCSVYVRRKRRHKRTWQDFILSSLRLETGLNHGDSDPSSTLLQLRLRRAAVVWRPVLVDGSRRR